MLKPKLSRNNTLYILHNTWWVLLWTLSTCIRTCLCDVSLCCFDPGFVWLVLRCFGRQCVGLARVCKSLARLLPVLLGLRADHGDGVQRHGSSSPQTWLRLSDFQFNLWEKRKPLNQIRRLVHFTCTRRISPGCLTGSFIPVPSLPSPSPFFQPIFSNILRPLLTSLISLWEEKHKALSIYVSDLHSLASVKDNMLTRERKQAHRLVGKGPGCPPPVAETLPGPCILSSSGL